MMGKVEMCVMDLEQAKNERAKHLIRKDGVFQRDDGKCSSVIHLTRGGEIPLATRKIKGKGKNNLWFLCDECADDMKELKPASSR